MKSIIIYASVHHGNTKKIVDAIAKENEIETVDATQIKEKDLSEYDVIGFASGIYYGKFHQSILNFASVNLPEKKKVFLICTYGGRAVFHSMEEVVGSRQCEVIGKYSCIGYDTFGPFKLIGGISKGHPSEKELQAAVEFYRGLKIII
ncbi:MAG: flavodoxin family protein [Lachnospiraceae bacterium]|nr:flavodoxin family protein [Lachnospiraceae bacterium]